MILILVVLYCHMHIHLHIHMHIHAEWITTTQRWRTSEDFFRNIYISLYCKVCVWEGVEDWTKTAIYWLPSYGHQRCVFLVLLMLNQRPEGSAFCWVMVFSTTSCHQRVSEITGGPEGTFSGVCLSLPHSSLTHLYSNCLTSCLDRVI